VDGETKVREAFQNVVNKKPWKSIQWVCNFKTAFYFEVSSNITHN